MTHDIPMGIPPRTTVHTFGYAFASKISKMETPRLLLETPRTEMLLTICRDLHENDFYGEIPDLKYLRDLNLNGNRFSGSFPLPTIRTKTILQKLNLGSNDFEGAIPANAFQNMTQLVQL